VRRIEKGETESESAKIRKVMEVECAKSEKFAKSKKCEVRSVKSIKKAYPPW
jgi:hypothetical protein